MIQKFSYRRGHDVNLIMNKVNKERTELLQPPMFSESAISKILAYDICSYILHLFYFCNKSYENVHRNRMHECLNW